MMIGRSIRADDPSGGKAWALAFATASLLALPLALATSALLLPGDPDDPNLKVFIAAALLVVPVWTLAALVGLLAVRVVPHQRRTFMRAVGPATTLATSAWLLLFAWASAVARPVPETKDQVLAAQQDPHLWAGGARRMVAAAALLATLGLLGTWRSVRGRGSEVDASRSPAS